MIQGQLSENAPAVNIAIRFNDTIRTTSISKGQKKILQVDMIDAAVGTTGDWVQ